MTSKAIYRKVYESNLALIREYQSLLDREDYYSNRTCQIEEELEAILNYAYYTDSKNMLAAPQYAKQKFWSLVTDRELTINTITFWWQ